jgi:hypothetical protein
VETQGELSKLSIAAGEGAGAVWRVCARWLTRIGGVCGEPCAAPGPSPSARGSSGVVACPGSCVELSDDNSDDTISHEPGRCCTSELGPLTLEAAETPSALRRFLFRSRLSSTPSGRGLLGPVASRPVLGVCEVEAKGLGAYESDSTCQLWPRLRRRAGLTRAGREAFLAAVMGSTGRVHMFPVGAEARIGALLRMLYEARRPSSFVEAL